MKVERKNKSLPPPFLNRIERPPDISPAILRRMRPVQHLAALQPLGEAIVGSVPIVLLCISLSRLYRPARSKDEE